MTAYETRKMIGKKTWLAWGIIILFYAYQYVLRVIPNILLSYISEKFHVDGTVFGQFSGFYYTGYALAHLPAGFLVSRYGLKKVLPWAIFLSCAGALPIIYSNHWISAIIGRTITGVGSSFAPIAAFHLLSTAFPSKSFSKQLSMMVSIGLVAAIYAGAPLAYLVERFGCVNVINSIVIIGAALSTLAYLTLNSEKDSSSICLSDVLIILKNKYILLAALSSGLMVGFLEGFPDAWGASFLSLQHNLPLPKAAQLTSYIFFGMLVGCPICSYLSSLRHKYFQTSIAAGVAMSTLFFVLITGHHLHQGIIGLLCFIIGIGCGYQIPLLYVGSVLVPPKLSSLSTTTFNMIVMIFGHIIHSIVGILVEKNGGLNNLNALQSALSMIPVLCIAGLIMLIYVSRNVILSKYINKTGDSNVKST